MLSHIIDLLNERFGTDLGLDLLVEPDLVRFAATESKGLRRFAEQNTEEQFGYVFDKEFETVVMDRQSANDDLFRMFFDKPEFKESLTAWARHEVFKDIRGAAA